MPLLPQSQRFLPRATYAPISLDSAKTPSNALLKRAYLAALRPRTDEIDEIRSVWKKRNELTATRRRVLAQVGVETAAAVRTTASVHASLGAAALRDLGHELASLRRSRLSRLEQTINRLTEAVVPNLDQPATAARERLAGWQASAHPTLEGATVFIRGDKQPQSSPGSGPGTARQVMQQEGRLERPTSSPPVRASVPTSIGGIAASASAEQRADANEMLEAARSAGVPLTARSGTLLDRFRRAFVEASTAALTRGPGLDLLQPVGLLHLERIVFTPVGIERGELVHSVPLAPAEEVNLIHQEWSNTSEEFSKIVTDYMESYSEQGVTEKSDLAQATSSQDQHSSGLNTAVSASGGFGPVTVTASAAYNVADSASNSVQVSRDAATTVTKSAGTRTRQEHKVSFQAASASGASDQAVQRFVNPSTTSPTRVDYYQLMRRWQIDLVRYGLRMTYDFVIPEPGSDLLATAQQLAALRQQAESPFSDYFTVAVTDIQRNTYLDYAGQYGASVDAPPADSITRVEVFSNNWQNEDQASTSSTQTYSVDVPDGYTIGSYYFNLGWECWTDDGAFIDHTDPVQLLGASGTSEFGVDSLHAQTYRVDLTWTAYLTQEAFAKWQLSAWSSIRDAAQEAFEAQQSTINDAISTLEGQMADDDALTLRKVEREEVMKNVLRWLLGPSFEFVPVDETQMYASTASVADSAVWTAQLFEGEVQKFLHHAIEWENMLYLLYPYFWGDSTTWDLRRNLDHPDFEHRAFLRAGAARVVITIRPGFEAAFATFLETAQPPLEGTSTPYVTIADEMQEYAATNYPELPAADPLDARPLLTPAQSSTWESMQAVMAGLEQFKTANGRYPTTAEGVQVLGAHYAGVDAWGNPWHYESPGEYADYDLASYGADGQPGGDDDAADITSWAAGSIVARWHEFTPTPALDIAMGDALPEA